MITKLFCNHDGIICVSFLSFPVSEIVSYFKNKEKLFDHFKKITYTSLLMGICLVGALYPLYTLF